MNSDNPYTPVRIRTSPIATSNRPYYIYSTAVVMLLWAGIYVYLQNQGAVSADLDAVTVSSPARFARRMYEFNVVTIAILFILSIAFVNSALWVTLRICKR